MKVLDYFFASRPLLQLPIWTVYLVCLNTHQRLAGGSFGWTDLVIMAGLSLIFTGAAFLNQVYDEETDRINRKVGFLQLGLVSRTSLLKGSVLALILPMAVAPLIGLPTLFIFAQLVLLAYAYSAPPWRLKDRPVAGLLANAWSHGLLVALAVMPEITIHNAGLLGWDNPVYFFLTVGGTYAITTVPDRPGDLLVGKRTLAVVTRRAGALVTALLFFALAAWVAWDSEELLLVFLALGAAGLTGVALVARSGKAVLLAVKLPLLALTLTAGWYFPGYLLFVVALLIATRIYYHRRFGLVYPVLL